MNSLFQREREKTTNTMDLKYKFKTWDINGFKGFFRTCLETLQETEKGYSEKKIGGGGDTERDKKGKGCESE